MKPFEPFEVRPLDHCYHDGEGGFREQMAVLRVAGDHEDRIKMIRSFLTVCQPGMSGFDPEHPGQDTAKGWKILDSLIENELVRGTFHTHPPGVYDFSGKDWLAMTALAQANGPRLIWHGVQAADADETHFVCLQVLGKQILCYDFGWFASLADLDDPVLLVPKPPVVRCDGSVIVIGAYE